MRRAVYYPHTQIRDEEFLKTSLLLWDEVEFVAPEANFAFRNAPAEHIEALELLCRAHVPNEYEKSAVHSRVVQLLSKPLPQWLVTTKTPKSLSEGRAIAEHYYGYGIYAEKLYSKTWELLEAAKLVHLSGSDADFYTKPMTGFFLMSLLADACAGTSREKITDRAEAYSFLWKMIATEQDGDLSPVEFGAEAAAQTGLVNIALATVKTKVIPFENFLAMRKREASGNGHHYRQFRTSFADKIHASAKKAAVAKTLKDRREVAEDLRHELHSDLGFLKDELRSAAIDLIFSEKMVALLGGGAFTGATIVPHHTGAIAGAAVGLAAGAVQAVSKISKTYTDVLAKHPVSYLYLGEKPKFRSLAISPLSLQGLTREP